MKPALIVFLLYYFEDNLFILLSFWIFTMIVQNIRGCSPGITQ